jgi:hypothetical protein
LDLLQGPQHASGVEEGILLLQVEAIAVVVESKLVEDEVKDRFGECRRDEVETSHHILPVEACSPSNAGSSCSGTAMLNPEVNCDMTSGARPVM